LICVKCQKPKDGGHKSYCKACHAAYMRSYRPVYGDLTPEEKYKANCRSKTKMAVKRKLIIKPDTCDLCKQHTKIEAHHEDYDKPYEVIWLCRRCHIDVHRKFSTVNTLHMKSLHKARNRRTWDATGKERGQYNRYRNHPAYDHERDWN
jgi:hypothetical protein